MTEELAAMAQDNTADRDDLGPYRLSGLPYAFDAFEPVIDAKTMRLHYEQHHQGYVDKTNAALARHPEWLGRTIEDVLRNLDDIPPAIRDTIRNHGGGHANHQFFWKIITPGGTPMPDDLSEQIARDYGSVNAFKTAFEQAGMALFGSGWVFLTFDTHAQRLLIVTLPNQDSVLWAGAPGLLCCDCWEHAYYKRYDSRRDEWIQTFWDIVDWAYVGQRLQGVIEGRPQL